MTENPKVAPGAAPKPARSWGRWLVGFALMAGMLGAGGGGLWWLSLPQTFPFEVVHITGELHHLKRPTLEKVVAEQLTGGFFSLDLAQVQEALARVPWVARASLRRLWPDRLELHVDERRPAARWSGNALVTGEGLVFQPGPSELPAGLPNLAGPDAESAPLLLERYHEWQALVQAHGRNIAELHLDARGAWSLLFADGLRLELGKTDVDDRLARFLRVLPQLTLETRKPERIDLRYNHGLAVQWGPEAGPEPGRKNDSKGRGGARSGSRISGKI